MTAHLNTMGAPLGITFTDIDFLPNSRLSLEAAEFARERGSFDEFHEAVFRAYFSNGKNIGQVEILKGIAQQVGLDAAALEAALQREKYVPALQRARAQASRWRVTAIPAFVLEDERVLVGAQPLDVFRQALASLQS